MNKNFYNNDNSVNLIIFFSFLIVIFTNDYSVSSVFSSNSAARSGEFYLDISSSFPFASEAINYHHAQRFLFPYLIGFLSKISDIDDLIIFSFSSYNFLFAIFLIKIKISKLLNLNPENKLFFFLLFIFNPYILRYFSIYPSMVVDLIFILSGYVFIFYLLNKRNVFLYISIFLAVSTRQTGILILFGILIFYIFLNKDKVFYFKNILISLFISIIVFALSFIYTIYGGYEEFPSSSFMGIFIYIKDDLNIYELLKFLIAPGISILPIFIFYLINKIKKNSFNLRNHLLLIILISFLICAQPILGGPNWTGKNVIRLSTLAYPYIFYIIFLTIDVKKKYNFLLITFFLIFLTFWSFHPTFSKVKIFKDLSFKSFLI